MGTKPGTHTLIAAGYEADACIRVKRTVTGDLLLSCYEASVDEWSKNAEPAWSIELTEQQAKALSGALK